jgi:hypothetical protein
MASELQITAERALKTDLALLLASMRLGAELVVRDVTVGLVYADPVGRELEGD